MKYCQGENYTIDQFKDEVFTGLQWPWPGWADDQHLVVNDLPYLRAREPNKI